MKIRNIMMLAKAVSMLSSPFYLPIIGLTALFIFSYLNLLPFTYKVFVLLMVYIFTIFLPTKLIRFYHHYHGWTPFESEQEKGESYHTWYPYCAISCATI